MSEYIKCDGCNGNGIIITPAKQSPPKFRWYYCTKCRGTGRLNWLENIFKKRQWLTSEDRKLQAKNVENYLKGNLNKQDD